MGGFIVIVIVIMSVFFLLVFIFFSLSVRHCCVYLCWIFLDYFPYSPFVRVTVPIILSLTNILSPSIFPSTYSLIYLSIYPSVFLRFSSLIYLRFVVSLDVKA